MNPSFNYNQPSYMTPAIVRVTKFILIPTKKKYEDIYQRSLELNGNISELNKLEALFNTVNVQNHTKLSDYVVANAVPELMSINNYTTGRVEIPNGWGTQRMRYLMEVVIDNGGMITKHYLQGFSEYHSPSYNGLPDPAMDFYINSITTVTCTIDPITGYKYNRPTACYNVITDLAGGKKYQETSLFDARPELKLIRPTDLIDQVMYSEVSNMDTGYSHDATPIILGGNVGDKNSVVSDRGNNDAIKYFTKTVNSMIDAKSLVSGNDNISDIYTHATGLVSEKLYNDNEFVDLLSRITGEISPTKFTINVLERLDPQCQAHVATGDNAIGVLERSHNILDTEHTANMLQPTMETKIATTIAHSMSSMLADNMLTGLSVSFTNVSGKPVVWYTSVNSFIPDIDYIGSVNKVMARIEHVLMPELTYGNQLIIEAHIVSDLTADTTIALSINMSPLIPFRFPTFADALFSPVISDAAHRSSMASKLSYIVEKTYN